MIPPIDPATKLLPASSDGRPYTATIAEIRQRFVIEAPFQDRRALIFEALDLYARLVWSYWPQARLWVNGGFVTHKNAPPHDVDVAFLVPGAEIDAVMNAHSDAQALLTLQGVDVQQPNFRSPRIQPFGGLVDSFFVPSDQPLVVDVWRDRWSTAPTVDGSAYRTDVLKGFLEVTQ